MKYSELAAFYDKLQNTSKRLEKTYFISQLYKKTSEEEIDRIVLLAQGRVFPLWDDTQLGVSDRLVIKAISSATGTPTEKIEDHWKRLGDLGEVAEHLVGKKSQSTLMSQDLTVNKVWTNIHNIAKAEGSGSVEQKIRLMSELLANAKPLEARYLVRTFLQDLRAGVGTGSVRDAIVWAFFEKEAGINYNEEEKSISPENREEYKLLVQEVQAAFDLKADFAEIARLIKKKGRKGLEELQLKPGSPVNVMLFQKAKDLEDAFERVGKPCALEFKYDGFRMLIHKDHDKVMLFTRRLEEVTAQFPEVAGYVKEAIKAKVCILDGEAVGYDPKTDKYLPFQAISQRIRRKHGISEMARELPIEVNIFDILLLEDKNLLKTPYLERRHALEKIIHPKPKKLVLSKQIITDDIHKARAFYTEALQAGEEGVMAKNLEGIYQPGSRVGFGVKVKPVMENLDLVIVGAEWGTGKRGGWLTSYVLACRQGKELLEIGKVGTGIKELEEQGVSFEALTQRLKPLIIKEQGKIVSIKPELVIEVAYEEIQKSPTYSSGYALRFPRFLRIREDRGPGQVSEIGYVEQLYKQQ